jgi:integrase
VRTLCEKYFLEAAGSTATTDERPCTDRACSKRGEITDPPAAGRQRGKRAPGTQRAVAVRVRVLEPGKVEPRWTRRTVSAFHDLRREFASRLLESGASDHEVRDWLGHANITTTSRYLSTTRVRLQRARAVFELRRSGLAEGVSAATEAQRANEAIATN